MAMDGSDKAGDDELLCVTPVDSVFDAFSPREEDPPRPPKKTTRMTPSKEFEPMCRRLNFDLRNDDTDGFSWGVAIAGSDKVGDEELLCLTPVESVFDAFCPREEEPLLRRKKKTRAALLSMDFESMCRRLNFD